jgi:hypothetical protein
MGTECCVAMRDNHYHFETITAQYQQSLGRFNERLVTTGPFMPKHSEPT